MKTFKFYFFITLFIVNTILTNKSYSLNNLNDNFFSFKSNLFEYNGLNTNLNTDSEYKILFQTNSIRKFENTDLYSGGINLRSPLLFKQLNFAFDINGDFSNIYKNYSIGLGVISRITSHYNLGLFYNHNKNILSDLDQNSYSNLILTNSYEINKINISASVLLSNWNEEHKMNLRLFNTIAGYEFSDDYILEFIYNYDYKFKNIFGVSNKIKLGNIIQLYLAYYINPNRLNAGVLIDFNQYFNFAVNLDKSEFLPYFIVLKVGVRI